MRRWIVFLPVFCLWLSVAGATGLHIKSYRYQMDLALDDATAALQFYRNMEKISAADHPVVRGYKAMSLFLMCRHVSGPVSKWNYFSKGKKILEQAIAAAPDNAELRYFRFTTQSNVPGILQYNSQLEDDKQVLIAFLQQEAHVSGLDIDLCKRIRSSLESSNRCTSEDKAILKQIQLL